MRHEPLMSTSHYIHALESLIAEAEHMRRLLAYIADAWRSFEHADRVQLGREHPSLVEQLLKIENEY